MSAPANGERFMLINAAGRTAMDLGGGSAQDGQQVYGFNINTNAKDPAVRNQIWKMEFVEPCPLKPNSWWIKLRNEASGTFLDLAASEPRKGAKIQGWSGSNDHSQQWAFYPVQGSTSTLYVLVHRGAYEKDDHRFWVADLDGGNPANATKVQGYLDTSGISGGNLNQAWMLVKMESSPW